jgi:KUP system potassium uptake protein
LQTFTLLLAAFCILIMSGWYFGRKIKNRYITFSNLDKYLQLFKDLKADESIPRTSTNLVYIITANRPDQVESKVLYSIFQKQPKRADTYWLLHVNKVNEPNRFDYQVETKINLYFREVLEDLIKSKEIRLDSSYESLRKHNIEGDFKFILIDRILSRDYIFTTWENFILSINNLVRRLSISDINALQLDSTNTIIEQVPIIIDQPVDTRINRND